MDEITAEQIRATFPTLPPDIRELLEASERQDKTMIIGKKYGLTRVETGLLSQVVTATLCGLLKPNQFVQGIMNFLTMDREKAVLIAQDINRDVFNSVREALLQVHSGVKNATPTPQSAPMSAAQPTTKPQPIPATPPSGSIFEQKLGGAFRMGAPAPTVNTVRDPMLVPPPPPAPSLAKATVEAGMMAPSAKMSSVAPTAPPQQPVTKTPPPTTAPSVDKYREPI